MLYLSGIVITFFLVAVLIGKPGKTKSDYLLTIWLLVIGVHLLLYYSVIGGYYLRFPYLLGVEIPLPLVYGPMLYLYTCELTRQAPVSKGWFVHFVPLLLSYLYVLPFYTLSTDQKIWVYQHEGAGFRERQFFLLVSIMLSGTLYPLFAFLRLRRHRKSIDAQFSNTEKINLTWLQYLILGMTLIWATVFIGSEAYIFATVVGFVFFIGYFGIRQTSIFRDQPAFSHANEHEYNIPTEMIPVNSENAFESVVGGKIVAEISVRQIKYAKSGLNPEMALLIYQKLQNLMQTERLFTDPQITLAALSEKLGTNTNHLSQVINTIESKNFYDYINALRTAEFIRISFLPENQRYNLLHLALECGFNSKTSFNRNFKRHTGFSPSDFLVRQNISLK
jgi:AraC-like DNA-binding protein